MPDARMSCVDAVESSDTMISLWQWRTCVIVLLLVSITPRPAGAEGDRAARSGAQKRPQIGVAFGGGSARGLAHVGVVRWFEEHRIPIDLIAGTSMGGLIGGAVSAGMSASELSAILQQVNWDEMFGFSPFKYKNIRRKEDARAYPSRIELGLKQGISLPIALNNGQQVDFLLTRITGPYGAISSFDDLPTPFRAIAVDLVTAQQVILEEGSLASALRATMSLPGIFPPVELDGKVLVDGGALNNVPADVVRSMGADVVIAINVGSVGDTRKVSRSLLGLMGQTVDVMMLAATRASLKTADIIINPALDGFASLDWRRFTDLEAQGYAAAEAMKEQLLPLAVGEDEWAAYLESRRNRRKSAWPAAQFVSVVGAVPWDRARIEAVLAPVVGKQALDVQSVETHLETLAGLDRYETVGWQLDDMDGRTGLRIEARPKTHAPPFLMLGISLQNTTTEDFAFRLGARYLTFDVVGSGSELRVDGTAGAEPSAGVELYRPFGQSALFVVGTAAARREALSFVSDDVVVARYNEDRLGIGLDAGVNLGRNSDVRLGMSVGDLSTNIKTGDPGLPELNGRETRARLAWRYDDQDNTVAPSSGIRAIATLDRILEAPDVPPEFVTDRSNDDITQMELRSSIFWPVRQRDRLFVTGGMGTTWGQPLATEQFQLGSPFRLGAYSAGEFRGDHYAVVTAGYLLAFKRLPDFLGGSVYLGGWAENGSAFDKIDSAKLRTNVSIGALADTLIGPVMLATSFDFSGAVRYYVGIGRLF
jgi:NTE family protein